MNGKQLKKNSAATIVGLVISVLLLAAIFILPELCTARLGKRALPLLDAVESAALAGDFDLAERSVAELCSVLSEYETKLNLFSHHKDVSSMMNAADSASRVVKTHDAARLMQVIDDIRFGLEYICTANDVSLSGIL